jgi:hypothetical protein
MNHWRLLRACHQTCWALTRGSCGRPRSKC